MFKSPQSPVSAYSGIVLALVVAGVVATASCSADKSPTGPTAAASSASVAQATGSQDARPSTPKLNLSHIECVVGGVGVHFVLLNVASGVTPGSLTGTYNGGNFGPVAPTKNTGNVWHYDVILPAGTINILSATVQVGGQTIQLHNPGDYAGEYNCPPGDQCLTFTLPDEYKGALVCLDKPLGSPGAECGLFGLAPQGEGDPGGAAEQTATQNAALAIVKDGTVGCGGGAQAYRFYEDVQVGDTLQQPGYPDGGNISHVTYCACP